MFDDEIVVLMQIGSFHRVL